MLDHDLLSQIWFLLLGVLLTGYAILDGFDFGVGMVHLLIPRSDRERRLVIFSRGDHNTIFYENAPAYLHELRVFLAGE